MVGNATAAELWLSAAKRGHVAAMFNIGMCFEYGHGVIQSDDSACEWFRKAASRGHIEALDKIESHMTRAGGN